MSTTRKLRRYKGWAYDPTLPMFVHDSSPVWRFTQAAQVIVHNYNLSDDDYAPLMDLKKEPYEPLSTLEDVVRTFVDEWVRSGWHPDTTKVVLSERIRAAFPHIDTPEGA